MSLRQSCYPFRSLPWTRSPRQCEPVATPPAEQPPTSTAAKTSIPAIRRSAILTRPPSDTDRPTVHASATMQRRAIFGSLAPEGHPRPTTYVLLSGGRTIRARPTVTFLPRSPGPARPIAATRRRPRPVRITARSGWHGPRRRPPRSEVPPTFERGQPASALVTLPDGRRSHPDRTQRANVSRRRSDSDRAMDQSSGSTPSAGEAGRRGGQCEAPPSAPSSWPLPWAFW